MSHPSKFKKDETLPGLTDEEYAQFLAENPGMGASTTSSPFNEGIGGAGDEQFVPGSTITAGDLVTPIVGGATTDDLTDEELKILFAEMDMRTPSIGNMFGGLSSSPNPELRQFREDRGLKFKKGPEFKGNDIELQVDLEKLIENNPVAQVALRDMMARTGGDLSKILRNLQVGDSDFATGTRGAFGGYTGSNREAVLRNESTYNVTYNEMDVFNKRTNEGKSFVALLEDLKVEGLPYPKILEVFKMSSDGSKVFNKEYYDSLSETQKTILQVKAENEENTLTTIVHELMHYGYQTLNDRGYISDAVFKDIERMNTYGFVNTDTKEHVLIDEILTTEGKIPPQTDLQLLAKTDPKELYDFNKRKIARRLASEDLNTNPNIQTSYEDLVERYLQLPNSEINKLRLEGVDYFTAQKPSGEERKGIPQKYQGMKTKVNPDYVSMEDENNPNVLEYNRATNEEYLNTLSGGRPVSYQETDDYYSDNRFVMDPTKGPFNQAFRNATFNMQKDTGLFLNERKSLQDKEGNINPTPSSLRESSLTYNGGLNKGLDFLKSAVIQGANAWLAKNDNPDVEQNLNTQTTKAFERPDNNPRAGYESGQDYLNENRGLPSYLSDGPMEGPNSFQPETYTGPVPELMAEGGFVTGMNWWKDNDPEEMEIEDLTGEDAVEEDQSFLGSTVDFFKNVDYKQLAEESLPIVGETAAIKRASDAFKEKDYLGTGIEAAAGVLGVVPFVGDIAGKALRAATKKYTKAEIKDAAPKWFKETPVSKNIKPEDAKKTQITTTTATYIKAKNMLPEGKTLDFGAGKGVGAKKVKSDTYEPFPDKSFSPKYTDAKSIPSNSYDNITNLNVLNVVKPEIRSNIVQDIGRILKPGGTGIITTRGTDVFGNSQNLVKGVLADEPRAVITSLGTYQKGFTQKELREYIKEELGNAFTVSDVSGLGKAGVKIIKKSNNLDYVGYNKGGPVMELDEQTEMAFGNGSARVDPVSGNEVPPGALPSEVRDDIPARLSEGEYVVPADVLQYYGIKFFEDLRGKAKMELSGMEQNGRMGGEPLEEDHVSLEEMPFGAEELQSYDDGQEAPAQGFNEGGPVTEAASMFPTTMIKTYVNEAGSKLYIRFVNGIAIPPVPPGYVEEGSTIDAVADPTTPTRPEPEDNDNSTGPPIRKTLNEIVKDSMTPGIKAGGMFAVLGDVLNSAFPTASTAQIMEYINKNGALPPSGRGKVLTDSQGNVVLNAGGTPKFEMHTDGPLINTIKRYSTEDDNISPTVLNTFKTKIYPAYLKNSNADGTFNKKGYAKDLKGVVGEDGSIITTLTKAQKRVDAIKTKAEEQGTTIFGSIDREAETLSRQVRDEQDRQEDAARSPTTAAPTIESEDKRTQDPQGRGNISTSGGAYSGRTGSNREFGMNKGGLATRKNKK